MTDVTDAQYENAKTFNAGQDDDNSFRVEGVDPTVARSTLQGVVGVTVGDDGSLTVERERSGGATRSDIERVIQAGGDGATQVDFSDDDARKMWEQGS